MQAKVIRVKFSAIKRGYWQFCKLVGLGSAKDFGAWRYTVKLRNDRAISCQVDVFLWIYSLIISLGEEKLGDYIDDCG